MSVLDFIPADQRSGLLRVLAAKDYAHTKASNYADPGYQKDGKKRYALDNEGQVRAAWSYIHQFDNAKLYTPQQVAEIKSKIVAAGKRFGIKFDA